MKSTFLTLLFALLLLPAATAQAQRLSGTVSDAFTREPLEGATIFEPGSQSGATTNAQGRFELDLPGRTGAYVEIRFVGYETTRVRLTRSDLQEVSVSLIPTAIVSEDVLVEAFRVDERSPVTYSNLSAEEIAQRNLGQDIPVLLEMSPSVVSTSDAGAGIGYTGLRIRGVDPQRINVTVNGIPLNDSESHGVFWVNMPDFASSLENVQIQRGVGTSAHGPAAFGATVNLQTTTLQPDAFAEINTSVGSFNTMRNNLKVGTGVMNNGWSFNGRLSRIVSDGYIDRASSDLKSFYVSGTRHSERGLLKVNVFSGQETTYQAWYGISEDQLRTDRRFNPAGMFTDPSGQQRFYDNQTDNYTQTHYQLHYSRILGPDWSANASLHYTRGAGYYEEFRQNNRLSAYGFDPVPVGGELISRTDLVRQRWLDNHFGGGIVSVDYSGSERMQLTLGGGYNVYDGDHFGEIIWTRLASPVDLGQRYYDNNGRKTDGNVYAKALFDLSDRLTVLADVQVRGITYTLDGVNNNQRLLDDTHSYLFVNPKTGFTLQTGTTGRIYGYFGISSKEPVRRDFTDATENYQPSHETLYNAEFGYRGGWERVRFGVNAYYMYYDNQLVNTGEINDVGDPVRTNVPESYRAGVELEASALLPSGFSWNGHLALSRNRIREFTELLDVYDSDWNFVGQQQTIHKNSTIAFSPSVVGMSRVAWQRGAFQTDLSTRWVGRQYLDNTTREERSLDPWLLNDLRLAWEYAGRRHINHVRVQLIVHNLFDHLYESNGYTFGYIAGPDEIRENYFYPQAGRHVMAGITLAF